MKIINELRRHISKKLTLGENLLLYRKICEKYYDLVEELMVFETIIIPDDVTNYFSVSVSLQVENTPSPYQVRLNLNYAADSKLSDFNEVLWSDEVDDFFGTILHLPSCRYIQEHHLMPISIDILTVAI